MNSKLKATLPFFHEIPAFPGTSKIVILILCIFFTASILRAQDTITPATAKDTTVKVHSPKKATIYSAVLPGLGQAYNHKYWKIPIVYAGFATTIYFVNFNTRYYKDFRDAYTYKSTGSTGEPPNEYALKYSKDQLLTAREYYRRNLEISYIVTGLWYILNIVDATVDAHFYNYNISDDLSLKFQPLLTPQGPGYRMSPGISMAFKF